MFMPNFATAAKSKLQDPFSIIEILIFWWNKGPESWTLHHFLKQHRSGQSGCENHLDLFKILKIPRSPEDHIRVYWLLVLSLQIINQRSSKAPLGTSKECLMMIVHFFVKTKTDQVFAASRFGNSRYFTIRSKKHHLPFHLHLVIWKSFVWNFPSQIPHNRLF